MVIDRNEYIEQLLAKRWNGKVKIVTGIRRSGKSFLLSTLFKNRLIEEGAGKEDSEINHRIYHDFLGSPHHPKNKW